MCVGHLRWGHGEMVAMEVMAGQAAGPVSLCNQDMMGNIQRIGFQFQRLMARCAKVRRCRDAPPMVFLMAGQTGACIDELDSL